MTKLAFYVMNDPKHDEAKAQLSFKGRISLPKRNENDAPRGLIFDVLVTNADDLTVSMLGLTKGAAVVADGLFKTNPRDVDDKHYENPILIIQYNEENPQIEKVEKLGKETQNVLSGYVNFVREPNERGWMDLILGVPAGKDKDGNYVSMSVFASAKASEITVEKGKRYEMVVSPYMDTYEGKEKIRAFVWSAKEVEATTA